jgi:general stress protein 26
MATKRELEDMFWKALSKDMTIMLGLIGESDGHMRPMTAQVEDGSNTLWFFSATDTAMVKKLKRNSRATAAFVSKGHDVYATLNGRIALDKDPEMIDRLWNRYVAAWYKKGKDDPKLALLRFEPEEAEIWKDGSSLVAGIRLLLGSDPKKDYKKNVAKIALRA